MSTSNTLGTYRRLQRDLRRGLLRKRRKNARRVFRFNLRFLLAMVAVAALSFVAARPIYQNVSRQVDKLTRDRDEALERLRSKRPAATMYRQESIGENELGYLLQGECKIGGIWNKYWVYDWSSRCVLETMTVTPKKN